MQKYFRIEDDVELGAGQPRIVRRRGDHRQMLVLPARWYLGRIRTPDDAPVEPWQLCLCKSSRFKSLKIDIQYEGRPNDVTLIARSVPIVTQRIADLLSQIAPRDFERIPVLISGQSQPFAAINILRCCDCVDEANSKFDKWPCDERPELAGKFRTMYRLVIDPTRGGLPDIFRIERFAAAFIVSEKIKRILEEHQTTGVIFRPVTL